MSLEIKDRAAVCMIYFRQLGPTDTFKRIGLDDLFMKTKPVSAHGDDFPDYNCVNLTTGEIDTVGDRDIVSATRTTTHVFHRTHTTERLVPKEQS